MTVAEVVVGVVVYFASSGCGNGSSSGDNDGS